MVTSADGQFTRFKALTEEQYSEFAEKVPRAELFRCRACPFVDRFPSKVRRHFYYRHSVVPPYRCGHCSFRAVERGKVVKHCRSAHPSRRVVVLTQDSDDVTSSAAASDINGDEETIQRPGCGTKTSGFSSLRNVGTSSDLRMNSQRDMTCDDAVGVHNNKTANRRLPSKASSECLSAKDVTNDDSLDESDDVEEDDYESSDEYQPPSSKKKSEVSRRAQPRGEIVSERTAAVQRLNSESDTLNDNDTRNGNVDEEDEIPSPEAGDDPACDHIPCETIFAINRTTYRPLWRSQTPSDREDTNVRQPVNKPPPPVQIKTEPADEYEYQSSASRASGIQTSNAPATDRRSELPVRAPVNAGSAGSTNQRQFYCVYCGLTSRWNRRDVRLHVMHVHVGVRAFSCSLCGFSNSRNRAVVRSHCAKSHPGRKAHIIDNEPLFEAIDTVQEQDNLVSIAFITSDGTPLLTSEELDKYLSANENKYLSAKGVRFRTPTTVRKTSLPKAVLPDPETVRETIRNSLSNQSQPSELTTNEYQVEELNCQWKCRQCDFRDSGFAQVESHVVKHHLHLEPYSCPHCHKYFSESREVLFHIDEEHAGTERQTVSTVDEKSQYIRRNIECISVEVEPASMNSQTEFRMDHAGTVQSQSSDVHLEKSNSKEKELAINFTGVPHVSGNEDLSNVVHSSDQEEPLQKSKVSPNAKDLTAEEMDPSSFSNNILISSQEELRVSDKVPPTLSCSSAEEQEELQNEECSNDESMKSVENVRELRQETNETLKGNQVATCNDLTKNDVPRTSHMDHMVSDALPASVAEQDLLRDSAHSKEHPSPLSNLSVSSATLEITTNLENGDNWRTVDDVEQVKTDALLVSPEEQDSFEDSSHTQQPSDVPVPSIITSSTITNEGDINVLPTLTKEQLSSADDHTQQFSDASKPVADSHIITDEEEGHSRVTSHVESNISDGLAMSAEEQRSFEDSSPSIGNTQQSIDTLVSSTTSGISTEEDSNEDWKNNHAEEITDKAVPVSLEEESVKIPLEEHVRQHSNLPPHPNETETETAHEKRNDSYLENPHLQSNQVLGTGSSDIMVGKGQPSVDANTSTQDKQPDDQATAINPLSYVGPNVPEERKESNDSSQSFADQASAAARQVLSSEDSRPNSIVTNDSRPSSAAGRETKSARLSEDDGLSSDSSLSDDTSTWRCDDCSFVATSESLLVAHQRSRQQYRCVYCPDFLHSSVVHLRHHCLTRHPGKPISYKHTVIPCSEIKSTRTPGNASKAPVSSAQSTNSQKVVQHRNVEKLPDTVTETPKPANTEPDNSRAEKSDEGYCLDFEESSNAANELEESSDSVESDNSEDEDWNEHVPKKKFKLSAKGNMLKTPKEAGQSTGGVQGTIVCDLCNSYSTTNTTVMRHHVMSHLQYYPYFCPHCTAFRSVRSFPIIKHIRMKHPGKPESFECSPDSELEKKVRKSCHRVKSNENDHRASMETIHELQPPQPMETKAASKSRLEEREPVVAAAPVGMNKSRKILYKCKICGLKTHLRGDFRHHLMRELQYKPFK